MTDEEKLRELIADLKSGRGLSVQENARIAKILERFLAPPSDEQILALEDGHEFCFQEVPELLEHGAGDCCRMRSLEFVQAQKLKEMMQNV